MEEYERFIGFLYKNISAMPEMMKEEKESILYALKAVLLLNPKGCSDETRKNAFYILLYITSLTDVLNMQERWGMYLNLVYLSFVYNDYDDYKTGVRNAYSLIESYFEELVKKSNKLSLVDNKSEFGEENSIVIVTSQFLREGHAPTRRVLDYAYTLKHDLEMSVIIINDAGLHCEKAWNHYNYIQEYNNIDSYSYKGVDFPFYQVKNEMPDEDEIILLYDRIREYKPKLVLNVGANSIVSDICRLFAKTASIPCAIDIPISKSEYLLLPRNKRESDSVVLNSILPYQRILCTKYNYIYPKKNTKNYNRDMFNVSENAFIVAVVGNRLDEELNDDYLYIINRLLNSSDRILFMVIGEVVDNERIKRIVDNYDSICFTGQIPNAGDILTLIDIYINPMRSGGGRSAFEALYHGKPVISLKYGDVWGTVGDDFTVNNYDEMFVQAIKLYEDHTYYMSISQKAKTRADELEDMKTTFSELLYNLGIKH